MKNPFPVLLVAVLFTALCYCVFLLTIPSRLKTPAIPPPPAAPPTPAAYGEVGRVNTLSSRIKSLSCTDVDVTLQQRMSFSLKGQLYYEKPKRFRLVCSLRGKTECDLGSNDREFWFWSRHMKPVALFWCDHEHMLSTRLRTPLNPVWMMECIGFSPVGLERVSVLETQEGLNVYEPRLSTQGQVTKVTTILPSYLIGAHALMQNSQVIASSRVTRWQPVDGTNLKVPHTLVLDWHEEGVRIVLVLNRPVVNAQTDARAWEKPATTPAIYMPNY